MLHSYSIVSSSTIPTVSVLVLLNITESDVSLVTFKKVKCANLEDSLCPWSASVPTLYYARHVDGENNSSRYYNRNLLSVESDISQHS